MKRGEVIGERFEILEEVAAGGMGVVFRARDRETGGDAAVKLLYEVDPALAERFALEARLLEELRDPGIVAFLASGHTPGGARFLAMEWLEGQDLAARLGAGPLEVGEAVRLAYRVAEILAHAHERGVIHRDVKPANIFLPDPDVTKLRLLDFGVARLAGESLHLTRTGAVVGTPSYMSPEQIRMSRSVDPRADLFSLGCVLFECLCGRPPFEAATPVAVMTRILFDEAPDLAELCPQAPPALAALVAQLLEKNRARRPTSAAAVAAALLEATAPGPRRRAATDNRALTTMESRLVSVVIAGGSLEAPAIDAAPLERAAEKHGARIERLIDGSVAAVLSGAAAAHDLCASAARCALALRRLLPAAPMALATGRAVLGATAPLAEVIERAAELAASPPERGIAVDELTARLLGARFEVASDPFALLAERRAGEPSRELLGKPTSFVGRDRELLILEATLEECVEEPAARAVLLVGRAGVGKSRLREEFVGRAGDELELAVWQGRGDPMRQGSPYALLSQVVLGLAGVKEDEPAEESRAKLMARVEASLAGDEAKRVAEFLGELSGVRFPDEGSVPLAAARRDPQLMADQTRRAFEDFLVAESGAAPLLLVLEDLQWGDRPSLSIVDSALRRAAERPVMVLGAARPEVEDQFPSLWRERNVVEIRLGKLSRRAARSLVTEALGPSAEAALVDRILEQAAGNAFYLEEILRQVIAGDAEHLPETVVAMAQSRLEAMPEAARRVLRAASVFGETFWSRGLVALLSDLGSDAIEANLALLVDREVISQQPTSRFSDAAGAEYLFRHSLLRDAAYAMLPDHDLALGHRLAAEWLEAAGESDALLLAQHLERGAEPRRAGAFYRRAAEEALEANDLDAAIERSGKATACGVSGAEAAELLLIEATAYRWQAKYDEAQRRATDALRGLPPLAPAWYRAIEEIAEASLPLGKVHRLVALGNSIHPPPGRGGARDEFVVTAATAAMQLYLAGKLPEADALMQRLERAADRAGALPPLAAARTEFARGTRAMMKGDIGLTLEHARRAVAAYDAAGDLRNGALMRTNLAYAFMELGAYDQAEATLRESSRAAERIGLPAIAAYAQQNLGAALCRQDRLDEALHAESEALAALEGARDLRNEGFCLIYLGQIHQRRGDATAAESSLRHALEVLAEIPPARAYAEAVLASLLRQSDRMGEARELAQSAMGALEELGGIDEGEAVVRLEHALSLLAAGERERAQRSIAEAHARLEARAKQISDETWRRSFLEEVPENRRTRELARVESSTN